MSFWGLFVLHLGSLLLLQTLSTVEVTVFCSVFDPRFIEQDYILGGYQSCLLKMKVYISQETATAIPFPFGKLLSKEVSVLDPYLPTLLQNLNSFWAAFQYKYSCANACRRHFCPSNSWADSSHTVAGEVPGMMILGGRGPTQLSSWQKSGSASFAPWHLIQGKGYLSVGTCQMESCIDLCQSITVFKWVTLSRWDGVRYDM